MEGGGGRDALVCGVHWFVRCNTPAMADLKLLSDSEGSTSAPVHPAQPAPAQCCSAVEGGQAGTTEHCTVFGRSAWVVSRDTHWGKRPAMQRGGQGVEGEFWSGVAMCIINAYYTSISEVLVHFILFK